MPKENILVEYANLDQSELSLGQLVQVPVSNGKKYIFLVALASLSVSNKCKRSISLKLQENV